ncbi:MAG: endonuclease/exonuclease/phosphatase [Streptosporangiaceae bacterium]
MTVAVLAEMLRYALPQYAGLSAGSAAGLALVAALAGLLAVPLRLLAGPRSLVAVGVGGLLLTRLLAQALSPGVALGALGAACGMLALTALYESSRGLSGVGFATAAIAGLAVDTSLRMAFGTWDPIWRSGPVPWAVCLVVVAVGGAALARELGSGMIAPPAISWRDALGAAALGPFMALQVLVLSSPAFVASSGWLSLTNAHVVLIAGQALALAFLASGLAVRAVPGGLCVLGGTLLGLAAASVAGTYALNGNLVVIALIPAQILAAWLLAVACRAPLRRASARPARETGASSGPVWRVDVGAAAGGFALLAILVPYTLNPSHPLPFPNNALSGAAGVLLGLLAAIAAARGGPLPARAPLRALVAAGASLVLLAGTAIFAWTAPDVPAATRAGDLRLVSYNIRQAMVEGDLDPEHVARSIEAQKPSVVLLQDVGRGAVASGTTDLGVWLSRRLGMRLVWGPGTDSQYGNAILTRLGVETSGRGRMFSGEEVRGYVWARIPLPGGSVDVWTTRLAAGADQTESRAGEVTEIVKAWSGAPRTVLAGDLSALQRSPELAGLTEGTGLRRAPGSLEQDRADGVFGTDDLIFSDVVQQPGLLAVTVRVE